MIDIIIEYAFMIPIYYHVCLSRENFDLFWENFIISDHGNNSGCMYETRRLIYKKLFKSLCLL